MISPVPSGAVGGFVDRNAHAGDRLADTANAPIARRVDRREAARLGQAVRLEDDDTEVVDELGDLRRQRAARRHRVFEAAPEARC